jgi:hypothetical protein
MSRSFAILIGLALAARTASAETKSWAQLKNKLPANTLVVGGVDMAAIRGTSSFPKLVDWYRAETQTAVAILDAFKPVCGMDMPSMVADASVAFSVTNDLEQRLVLVLGLGGMNQGKVTDCITKLLAKVAPTKMLAVKSIGKLTEYDFGSRLPDDGKPFTMYASWLASDVVAIEFDDHGHAMLDAMTTGTPASGDLATYVAKTNPAAPAWAAVAVNGDGWKGGFATVTLGKAVKLTARMTGLTAQDGAAHRQKMSDRLRSMIERSASKPELKRVLQAVTLGGKDVEATLDATLPEASLGAVLPEVFDVL